jgi:hypothetical protein
MTTFSVQPNATAGQDTYMYLGNATKNYGTGLYVATGKGSSATYVYRTLIKFDLSSIPSNATVSSATLSLYYYFGTDGGGSNTTKVYRQLKDWTESGSHWNNYKTDTAWTEAGGFHADDCEQTEIGTVTISDITYEWKNISLTASKVQEWIDGTLTNNGMLLKATDETATNNHKYFRTSDYTDDTSLRPKFEVVYTVPTSGNPHYYFAQL